MKITARQFAEGLYGSLEERKQGEVNETIKRFAGIIVASGQAGKAEKIIAEFVKIWNRKKGIAVAEIASARKLDRETVKLLDGHIAKLTGAEKIELTEKIDESLLGGAVIRYGDKVADGSLKAKLKNLKEVLVK